MSFSNIICFAGGLSNGLGVMYGGKGMTSGILTMYRNFCFILLFTCPSEINLVGCEIFLYGSLS